MSRRFWWLWRQLGGWRQRQRARRQQLRQRQREQQRALWGGPVQADRVLAFSDAVFAIAITLLTLNLQVRPGLHGADFTTAVHQVLPALGAYVLSFVSSASCGWPTTASSASSPAWTTRSWCATWCSSG
jgi:hypothetical protein